MSAGVEQLTSVGEVKGAEERVVVFGGHSGVWGVKNNPVGSQQRVHLFLQLLFFLDDGGRGFGHASHLE